MYGRHVSELDTPALCIDLDCMDRNMAAMTSLLQAHGKQWRPHIKCHKTPALAHQQLAAGAIGVTSAKVSEAEVFLQNGVRDVLIANMIVGQAKLERLAGLCRWGDPVVAVDHYVQAEALSDLCRQRGVTCRIILEVNVGLDRVGVRPGLETRDLARGVAQLPGVQLAGIMGYEGHLCVVPDAAEKAQRIASAMAILAESREQMLRDGLCCDIVSAGGTGTYPWTVQQSAVTEIQAGGGSLAIHSIRMPAALKDWSRPCVCCVRLSAGPSWNGACSMPVANRCIPIFILRSSSPRPLDAHSVTHKSLA